VLIDPQFQTFLSQKKIFSKILVPVFIPKLGLGLISIPDLGRVLNPALILEIRPRSDPIFTNKKTRTGGNNRPNTISTLPLFWLELGRLTLHATLSCISIYQRKHEIPTGKEL